MADKFSVTYKLFHNSSNQIDLGEITFNGKRIKYDLKNMDKFSDAEVKSIHANLIESVKGFYFDNESEKRRFPIRYDYETCLELVLR